MTEPTRRPIGDLVRNRDFRRLLATRLTGSFGDGVLQAALATFVLFSPERQTTALAVAASFGILLLPYSLIGPFAGVYLDRWRRRQVLVFGNWLRAGTTLVAVLVVSAGHAGLDLGLIVLATLGIGRFVLSGLSASLPHVVPADELVTANSVAPTAGTVIYGIGALAGIALRGLVGGGDAGAAAVLFAAAGVYALAGFVPLLLRRDQLGPSGDRPGESLGDVWRGFGDGFRVLAADGPSWRSVAVVLWHRTAFGALTVLLLLIVRNALHPTTDPDAALRDFSVIAAAVTFGALAAAVVTPTMTRRIGSVRWTALTLVIAAATAPASLLVGSLTSLTVGGVILGLAQQSAKIGSDTILQRRISDDHLGRVFSLVDVGVNVCLVLGALLVAAFAPDNGVTVGGFVLFGVWYAVAAIWYLRGSRPQSLTSA